MTALRHKEKSLVLMCNTLFLSLRTKFYISGTKPNSSCRPRGEKKAGVTARVQKMKGELFYECPISLYVPFSIACRGGINRQKFSISDTEHRSLFHSLSQVRQSVFYLYNVNYMVIFHWSCWLLILVIYFVEHLHEKFK